jgi:hypothetical protein
MAGTANLVPNALPNRHSKYRAKEYFLFSLFFLFDNDDTIMYDDFMMTNETTRNEKMYTAYAPVHTGHYIHAKRNDGRYFSGKIESVKALPKGTMIVVKDDRWEDSPTFKSVYLENLVSWDVHPNRDIMAEKYSDLNCFNRYE